MSNPPDTKPRPFRPPEPNELRKVLDAHVAQLGEFFDSVQVIATYRTPDRGTGKMCSGVGNWYAREGSVREHILETDERSREWLRHENDE